jgi:AcrR family transcriptional regulator
VRRSSAARAVRGVEPEAVGGSRERILDAAERLVGERGYTAASISLIAAASGLPSSSIYWHFGSKENLLAAVVERGAQRWLRAQARWSSFHGDLSAFLRATGQAAAQHPDFLRVLVMLMLDGREGNPQARQAMRTVWRGVEARLERILAEHFGLGTGKRDVEFAAHLARFTLAFIDGAFLDSQIDPEGTPIPNLFADLAVALEALVAAHKERK